MVKSSIYIERPTRYFIFFSYLLLSLRHSSDRVGKLESLVESYKKKLEDLGDLRRQVKLLEERNTVYMQRTCQLEDELHKAHASRSQVEGLSRQVSG